MMVNKTAATAMVLSSFIFSTECNVYVESMSCIVLQGVVLTCKRLARILSLTTYKASLTVFVYRPIEIMAMLGQQYCLAVSTLNIANNKNIEIRDTSDLEFPSVILASAFEIKSSNYTTKNTLQGITYPSSDIDTLDSVFKTN